MTGKAEAISISRIESVLAGTRAGRTMNILLTGFYGTSSELLIKKASHKSIILPNHKVMDSQLLISEIHSQGYDYIFSFGQKPNIKNKLYIETAAHNMTDHINTNCEYTKLKEAFEANQLSVQISDNAGVSLQCLILECT